MQKILEGALLFPSANLGGAWGHPALSYLCPHFLTTSALVIPVTASPYLQPHGPVSLKDGDCGLNPSTVPFSYLDKINNSIRYSPSVYMSLVVFIFICT